MSPQAAKKAERAGVVVPGRANTVRLYSAGPMTGHLQVEGKLSCWFCKTQVPFSGQIFGRVGLAGTYVLLGCPQCNARIWTGFSSHPTGEGTDVYLYAPTPTREYARAEAEPLPAPFFNVDRVTEGGPGGEGARNDWVDTLLSGLVIAVTRRDPHQEVTVRATQFVGQMILPAQMETVTRNLRTLLERERATYLRAILVETLACLRDEGAAQAVQGALRQTLESEDTSDESNLPLHDLCVLALLYGDGNGFLEAMEKGLNKVTITTRARKAGKKLTPAEVAALIAGGEQIDSFESTLGGGHWQQVHALLPLWVGNETARKDASQGWLQRLFGRT
jgi:hypothetical protein